MTPCAYKWIKAQRADQEQWTGGARGELLHITHDKARHRHVQKEAIHCTLCPPRAFSGSGYCRSNGSKSRTGNFTLSESAVRWAIPIAKSCDAIPISQLFR